MRILTVLFSFILAGLAAASSACADTLPSATAETPPKMVTRSCNVKQTLKGGIYVYIRCQENGKDLWLATVDREFKDNELITFIDAPPLLDFYSKFLDRTFPEVVLTDILPPNLVPK